VPNQKLAALDQIVRAGMVTRQGSVEPTMSDAFKFLDTPEKIAEAGERVYNLHRPQLESWFKGQFVAIDVQSEQFFVNRFAEAALADARAAVPNGVFHLIRIGFSGAFRIRFSRRPHDFRPRAR
jgi:hypothetical protein